MSRDASPLHRRVVFLVGVRRSGTNWLRRIIDAHPDASVIPGETYLFSHGIAPLAERVQHGLAGSARTGFAFVGREGFLDSVRDLCDRILGDHLDSLDVPVRLVAERTPDHVRHLDLIGAVYPDAAVIHIIRDGRDVARSLVSQAWGPQDHAEAAREWVSGIEAARAAATQLQRYLEVSYEDLLADPVTQVSALYRFLGVDDSDEVLRRALAEADVPYNVDPASRTVERAKWRGGLEPAELHDVLREAAPLLTELGYDVEERPRATLDRVTARADGAMLQATAALRRLRRGGRLDDSELHRQVLGQFDRSMTVVDDLLADLAARRFDDLARHFAPRARIRHVDGAASWDERGPAAVSRLGQSLADDVALTGRQLRGDVHPAHPTFTVVGTWEAAGSTHDRVIVVTRYGDRIDELVWYVLPRVRDGGQPPAAGQVP